MISSLATDITFTNKTATFTNLQGKIFARVELIRADSDGLVWRDGASGGRVCYTNLHPSFLEELKIPTNRIEVARSRAEHRTLSQARERARTFAEAQARLAVQAKAEAAESAAASSKILAQEIKADADAIATLEAQIADAKQRLRRAKAQAHDYNAANRYNNCAPYVYVKDSERAKIDEAKARLAKMKADFALKYKAR
jgi:hypothetical protein